MITATPIHNVNPLPYVLDLVDAARTTMMTASEEANPMRPMMWPIAPVDFGPALASARTGAALIDSALAVGSFQLTTDVRGALDAAASEASTGIMLLTSPMTIPLDPSLVSSTFNSSANWLGVASSLLHLQVGRPGPFTA